MHPNSKLGELTASDRKQVAEIFASSIRLLWVDDFYDGPLSGMAEYASRRYRFDLIDRSVLGHEVEVRQYWLIDLSPAQLAEEERWHDLFCTHVWTGFDYTGRPEHRSPVEEHAKFYEPYNARTAPSYAENHVVGWFQL